MTSCKDCIHCEACKNLYETHGDMLSGDSYICAYFKDRSKFIELPCKVGEAVYFIKKSKIIKDSVRDIQYDSAWKGFSFHTLVDTWYESDIGKKIYFTKEQAEQALKERNNAT